MTKEITRHIQDDVRQMLRDTMNRTVVTYREADTGFITQQQRGIMDTMLCNEVSKHIIDLVVRWMIVSDSK